MHSCDRSESTLASRAERRVRARSQPLWLMTGGDMPVRVMTGPASRDTVTRRTITPAVICGVATVVTDACLDAVHTAHASGRLGWLRE
jgi:hypothetical protein